MSQRGPGTLLITFPSFHAHLTEDLHTTIAAVPPAALSHCRQNGVSAEAGKNVFDDSMLRYTQALKENLSGCEDIIRTGFMNKLIFFSSA